ncbi:Sialidase precursor [Symmachiella macrocystis]|uniref:exo-alpha-sialidase n=1 Tax=Symmachiella macrocystis TaxID=2527985 RepID=A0A5C6BP62_9PLAN|nr:sialidase family protein [Symmachiella macrocystis]TWU13983.1 Sialidase precursor [Symmachiella macrocystis]
MHLRISLATLLFLIAFCTAPEMSRTTLRAADSETAQNATTLFELGEGKESEFGFRIPALARTNSGTLLAFAERRLGLHDHAENDIVLRRSLDGGRSWQPLQIVAEAGGDSLNDPCVVVLDSGRILLRYTHFPKGVHARTTKHTVIAEPGYGGPKNVSLFLTHSDDDGATWSKPRNVTRDMRRKTAISVGSPGAALQLTRGPHQGRIVFPNYEVYHLGGDKRKSANSVSYSDDGGASWKLSGTIAEPGPKGFGNEAQLAELAGGGILLSARDQEGGTVRKLSVSSDGGATWSPHRLATDLLTPQCMSSVMRYTWPNDQQTGVLLHTLPHTKDKRANGTIMISRDEGQSWKPARVIVPAGFEYSCLIRFPDGDIGCLYETDHCRSIDFQRLKAKTIFGDQ